MTAIFDPACKSSTLPGQADDCAPKTEFERFNFNIPINLQVYLLCLKVFPNGLLMV